MVNLRSGGLLFLECNQRGLEQGPQRCGKACKSRNIKATANLFKIRWHIGICGLKHAGHVAYINCSKYFIFAGEMNEGKVYRRDYGEKHGA